MFDINLGNLGSLFVMGIAAVVLVGVIFAVFARIASYYVTVAPNEVLIISGRKRKFTESYTDKDGKLQERSVEKGYRIVQGGGTVIWPIVESRKSLSLDLMTLEPQASDVPTIKGVKVTVQGVAQVKIGGDTVSVNNAAEQLLGKTIAEIKQLALQTMEGHLRAILGTMTVEEAYQDRNAFSARVQEVAADDMAGMGLVIKSFNINEISDAMGYIDALGKPQTAAVKRDAAVAEANADSERRVKQALANQAAVLAEQDSLEKQAIATNTLAVKVADLKTETDRKKAAADIAYEIRETELRANLVLQQGSVEVERQRQAGLAAEQSIAVAQKKTQAEVVVPASAAKEAMILTADGEKARTIANAQAGAEAIQLNAEATAQQITKTKGAEASGIAATLGAQAEGERKLAESRAANDQVNVTLEIAGKMIDAQIKIAQYYAAALGGMGSNMRIVQFAGGADGLKTGNPLFDMILQTPEIAAKLQAMSEGLSGKDVPTILAEVASIMRGTALAQETTPPPAGSPKVAAEKPASAPKAES